MKKEFKNEVLLSFEKQLKQTPTKILDWFPLTSNDNSCERWERLRLLYINIFVKRNRRPYQYGVEKIHDHKGELQITWSDQFRPYIFGKFFEDAWQELGEPLVVHYDLDNKLVKESCAH